jgi:HTH-type transcriptional regulator/antitoxin HipB
MVLAAGTVREFGAALRQARADAGLTQGELAERAGVSRRWVSAVETGARPGAELTRILAVAEALGQRLELTPIPPLTDVEAELLRLLGEDGAAP